MQRPPADLELVFFPRKEIRSLTQRLFENRGCVAVPLCRNVNDNHDDP